MALGPVQLLFVGFVEPEFSREIAAELDRLREHEDAWLAPEDLAGIGLAAD